MTRRSIDIAIFGSFERSGGVGRLLVNQIRYWSSWGYRVELIGYRHSTMFFPDEMPADVSFTDLGTSGKWPTAVRLWWHLYTTRPTVVLGTSHLSNMILVRSRRLPGLATRHYLAVHHTYAAGARPKSVRARRRRLGQVSKGYRNADGIVAVSEALASELRDDFGLQDVPISAIYNGVVNDDIYERAREAVAHPWLERHEVPVVLAAGHLSDAKDHATLIRAMARVREARDCRLVIVGEGSQRQRLEQLTRDLGLADCVDMPGYQENPYAWMARADVFVLPSRSEGMSNVLAEALALGATIVATDCPTGPRDVLCDGRYGRLVPVGDHEAMAAAIVEALQHGPSGDVPDEAVDRFRADVAARAYLVFFGLAAA